MQVSLCRVWTCVYRFLEAVQDVLGLLLQGLETAGE